MEKKDMATIKNDKESKNTYYFGLKEIIKYIPIISTIIYSLIMGINNMYYFWYSDDAEKFYGIPHKYFFDSVLGDFTINLLIIMAIVLALLSPPIIKKWLNKSRLSLLDAVVYSAMISIVIFEMLIFAVIKIIDSIKLNLKLYHLVGILIIIFLITALSFYIYIQLFTREENISRDNNHKETKGTENAAKRTKLPVMIGVVVVIVFFPLVTFLYFSVKLPSNTKVYEVTLDENDTPKIIVGEYKEYYILMDIKKIESIKKKDDKEIIKLVFIKYNYEFKKKEHLKIECIKFDQVEGKQYSTEIEKRCRQIIE